MYACGLLYTGSCTNRARIRIRRNVFVDKDMVPKVADFGLATNAATATEGCGTVQWAAPEVLTNMFDSASKEYNKMCDVYR